MSEGAAVGIVSPGAMGSAIGARLGEGGARVVTTLAGRSGRSGRLARAAGMQILPGLDEVVRQATVVLSVVPPESAPAVATDLAAAARRTGARPLVADLNAVSPATVVVLRERLADAGLDYVDGSVSGPPPRSAGTTRVYLSGPRAGEVATLPWPHGDVTVVSDRPDAASALKMCTASVYKGLTGLLAHAALTAEAFGVLDLVLRDLELARPDLVDGLGARLASAASKAWRFAPEMREIAATQQGAGLTPRLFEGLAAVYEDLAATPLGGRAPEQVDRDAPLPEVLAGLRPAVSGDV